MSRKKTTDGTTPIETVKHKDKRINIPTEELRDFVADDEARPKTILYPRDPSLDPQLVWKGKDEQDSKDLAVPSVPVYIQEKIHPQVIIENVRDEAKKDKPEMQISLFSDFNGIRFEEMIDFYQHEQNWSNRMILGDSLLVMTSLAEKERLKGKVQTIYIDPPYGIKFGSNWQVSTRKRDVKDAKAEDATRQPEQIKAFRDTWQLGIHSYLAYLRDRLIVSRELLTETGSCFVQIGDENVHLVRCLMDEVFGSENFVSAIYFATTGGFETNILSRVGDYLLWYAKSREIVKYRQIYTDKNPQQVDSAYKYLQLIDGSSRQMTQDEREGSISLPLGSKIYRLDNICGQGPPNQETPFEFEGRIFHPAANSHWKANYPDGMARLKFANRIQPFGNTLSYVRFIEDKPINPINNAWMDTGTAGFASDKVYVVQTNIKVIERCLLMTTDPGDLVIDPTCGSGTTAYVAEQWGRRWITIDTSRVALALAQTRLMAAKYPYYYLADSPEGIKKEAEITGKIPPEYRTDKDIRKGFVYRRVPHVTLKSIANNPDIKEGMTREQIDAAIAKHADTETLYDQPYEDGKRIRVTGPFTVESLSPHRILSTDEERPSSEIEAQKAAGVGQFENMILENLKKAGVQNTVKNERLKFDRLESYAGEWLHFSGEYTEYYSPHPDPLPKGEGRKEDSLPKSEGRKEDSLSKGDGKKEDSLSKGEGKKVDPLNKGDGKMGVVLPKSEGQGISKRVAVCIGPEHGTVGHELIKEAAKEALKGVGFDLLVICGFAFDAHASETAKQFALEETKSDSKVPLISDGIRQFGKLPILLARMNPDLAMGEELLKKTGAGNLFMVFGEPDLKIKKLKDGKMTVEIRGVDVYDPTTGQIRSSSTDDIACWFIDTNYNEESFFVRHAYFTGADEPYEKLKRALRAEVDESAWSMLYSTISRPFDIPEKGKIAVKVINHYGDEVLKVLDII